MDQQADTSIPYQRARNFYRKRPGSSLSMGDRTGSLRAYVLDNDPQDQEPVQTTTENLSTPRGRGGIRRGRGRLTRGYASRVDPSGAPDTSSYAARTDDSVRGSRGSRRGRGSQRARLPNDRKCDGRPHVR